MKPGNKPSGKPQKNATASAARTPAPPVPPSPREVRRRRLKQILAGMGIFTAGGLSAYLFQSGEKPDPIDPTARTARFDPSKRDAPPSVDPNPETTPLSPAGVSKPLKREPAKAETFAESLARNDVYVLEVPVSKFSDALTDNYRNPGFLEYGAKDELYSDLSSEKPESPLPYGVKHLISDGNASERIAVVITPDNENALLNKIFGGLTLYIGSPDEKENVRNRHALAVIAALIDCAGRFSQQFSENPNRHVEQIMPPETFVTETILNALKIAEMGFNSDAKSLRSLVSRKPPKQFEKMREKVLSMIPEYDLNAGGDDDSERLYAIRKDPDSSPLIKATCDALRLMADEVARSTLQEVAPAQSTRR